MNNNILKEIYTALDEKKALDISIIDISNISIMADYFVICSASNSLQIDAIVDNVEEKMKEAFNIYAKKEGKGNKSWILLDYGNIIVHIFDKESREFYDLDRIWADGDVVDIKKI